MMADYILLIFTRWTDHNTKRTGLGKGGTLNL